MTSYVAGFLFSNNLENVALVLKNRPAWQAGFYNAIGGKIEFAETPREAMVREFQEETGVLVETWREYAVLGDKNEASRVSFFTCLAVG